MPSDFFEQPILNSPYEYPSRHWELDEEGIPTSRIIAARRDAKFVTPIPKPKQRSGAPADQEDDQRELRFNPGEEDDYDPTSRINEVRAAVDRWRKLDSSQLQVTPETARLLHHWRNHPFGDIRPFFCQIEAVETLIWLTETAPRSADGKRLLRNLKRVNEAANPLISRAALKLATGAGKTMVMAMIIAWQTVNALRRPGSPSFTRAFLIVTPGITIRDRLRVLLPNDPDNYYSTRELLPADLIPEIRKARIVITNYHAFKAREEYPVSGGTRSLLAGRRGEGPLTLETEGRMIKRVMPELMGFRNLLVFNDEAHHCYREKPPDANADTDTDADAPPSTREEQDEAKRSNEAARLWISGLESVKRKLGIQRVIDLSATPFFLAGSGYREGSLFPWTMSNFSLMDAIECGIVKLPRVPVADNMPGADMPVYRNLWEHIGPNMPRKGRGKAGTLDPRSLPDRLTTAMEVLYGHYETTYRLWNEAGVGVPCFIIVCQNTTISKLIYDYVSGFSRENGDGTSTLVNGKLELFRNFDSDTHQPLGLPNTILVDSEQLESGEILDRKFRAMAADEIERFRRERISRANSPHAGEAISDEELLREVMNTVGKPGRLGARVRCVVSVSMLTEGWDANNVTHILGVRAFGTQLLCEQVVGRALRRRSYDREPEYADIFGIPFDFAARPVSHTPQSAPPPSIQVKALRPERDHLTIRFPRVIGYRIPPPGETVTAAFTPESTFHLTPEIVGPARVQDSGIIGKSVEMGLERMQGERTLSVIYHLTQHLITTSLRAPGEPPPLHLFASLKRIVAEWVHSHLVCKGGTHPALLVNNSNLMEEVCNRINDAVNRSQEHAGNRSAVHAILDPYNPTGSTEHVRFTTRKTERYDTQGPPPKNPVNHVVLDSNWEAEFCRAAEANPQVLAYTKNHNLGFEVPYRFAATNRRYLPDFIVLIDDGMGIEDPLHLVVEIKGFRGEDAKDKHSTMQTYWVPGVNNLGTYGRWAFAEFTDVWQIEANLAAAITERLKTVIQQSR